MEKEGAGGIFGCSGNNYYMVNYCMYNQFTEARTNKHHVTIMPQQK
jgi:hypothetical protein